MKPTAFIGSSSEALGIATAIRDHLAHEVDVCLWTDGVFGVSQETLDRLLKTIERFDFGVFVLGADDIGVSRWAFWRTPRDNVLLELGMYLGRLGRRRAFAVCEARTKVPSDLAGITIPRYRKPRKGGDLQSIVAGACDELLRAMRERSEQAELRLLPSTSLAIGYFENFVKKVCMQAVVPFGGRDWHLTKEQFRFLILVPKDFGHTFHENMGELLDGCGLAKVTVDAGGARPFPFHVRVNSRSGGLEIVDIPTTLSVIPRAIELHLGKEYVGTGREEQELSVRELGNFARTLRRLLERPEHARLRKMVEIRDWDGSAPIP